MAEAPKADLASNTQGPTAPRIAEELTQETLAPGDLLVLASDFNVPREFRSRPAIVKEVHEKFATVAVLTSNRRHSKGELWPNFKSLLGPVDRRLRLGARVRLVGLSGNQARMNGSTGEIVLDKVQKFHPLWRSKAGVAYPILTVTVKVDGHSDPFWIYPRYLEEEGPAGAEPGQDEKPEPQQQKEEKEEGKGGEKQNEEQKEGQKGEDASEEREKECGGKKPAEAQSEKEGSSESATATTIAGATSQSAPFEIPDWILSFAVEVDACVDGINQRRSEHCATPAAEPEMTAAGVAVPVAFERLPSVGSWLRPLLKPPPAVQMTADAVAPAPAPAPVPVPFERLPSVASWLQPPALKPPPAIQDSAPGHGSECCALLVAAPSGPNLPSPAKRRASSPATQSEALEFPSLLAKKSLSTPSKAETIPILSPSPSANPSASRVPRRPRSRRSEGSCWSCFSFLWVGK